MKIVFANYKTYDCPKSVIINLSAQEMAELKQLERLSIKSGLDVTIEKHKRKRSTGENSQNHRLNGFCMQIATATDNPFALVKMAVKERAATMGYPSLKSKWGTMPQSEADASVEECAILIQAAEIIAAEEGIILKE